MRKSIADHNFRAKQNRTKTSQLIHNYLKNKNEKAKVKYDAIEQKYQARATEIMEKAEERSRKIEENRKHEAMLQRYYSNVDNEINRENIKRMKLKEEYKYKKMYDIINARKTRMEETEDKKIQEIEEKKRKESLKEIRQRRLVEAYNYMAIWNAWDENIINDIALSDSPKYDIGNLMTEIIKNKHRKQAKSIDTKIEDRSKTTSVDRKGKNNSMESDKQIEPSNNN